MGLREWLFLSLALCAVIAFVLLFRSCARVVLSQIDIHYREKAKLPSTPEHWLTTQEVTLKYRILEIDGAEYILLMDPNNHELSLCPKVK